ncbi:hypothetical protein A1F94_010270 [Pyrenophora tritici-repentis]|nr:hypothetical protein A1F94_010270 [Pyrenophora tritici-repentis]
MPAFVVAPVTVNYTTTESCASSTSTHSVYSTLYPSPSASPVEITAQSQVVTSYIPEMTWCVGPPIEPIPMTRPPYLNGTTEYITTIAGTGSCETIRQVAGFNLALAAAVPRRDVATHTITKTIVYTEVRKLSPNITYHPGRNAEVARTEQLRKRGKTVNFNSNSTHDSSTDLYNLRVDLASEGYISIYVPSIAVSEFCDSVLKQGGDDTDIQELLLAVYNATNAVKIPVHRRDATSFCRQAQNKDGPKSSNTSGSLTASAIASREASAMSSSRGDTLESTTSSHKLKAFKTSASATDSDSSDISTPTLSNAMADNSVSITDSDDPDTSTSAKKVIHPITSSDATSTTSESATETSSDAIPSSSSNDDIEDASATLDSSSLPSQTLSADDASTDEESSSEDLTATVSPALEADESDVPVESTSSRRKKKVSTSADSDVSTTQAAGDASSEDATSADATATVTQAPEADESDVSAESTSSKKKKTLPTSIDSDTATPQETDDAPSEEAAVETPSTDSSSDDNSTDDSNDSTIAATANILDAADLIPHLTVSSINSWYNVINNYMSSAAATATVDLDVEAPFATADSIDSENGAARRGIRRTVFGNPALTVSWYDYIGSYMRTAGDEDDAETTTSTSTQHKPKSTKMHPSDPLITTLGKGKGKGHTGDTNPNNKDHPKSDKADGEKTRTKLDKPTSAKGHPKETQTQPCPKNAGQQNGNKAAPTLPSDISFALATPTKNSKAHSTTAAISTPPPGRE